MKIEGAIFDLDGTLLDSMYIWDTIGSDYLVSKGLKPEPNLNEVLKKMTLFEAANYYQNNYGIADETEKIINDINKMIENFYANDVVIKDGVLNLLKKLYDKNVKMCIATVTDKHLVKLALQNNGVEKYFCDIITSAEVGYGKDNPFIFEKALEVIGTKKEVTYVFEDALHAMETAKKAGFNVIGVYDKYSENESNQIKALCDDYITSYLKWGEESL